MRYHPAYVFVFASLLSACSNQPSLPEDIVGKAASCAIITASESRSRMKNAEDALPLDRQSQIIHYALLAGASGNSFSRENANAVVMQMQMLQDRFAEDKWVPLVAPCKAAFPEADLGRPVKLPEADGDAQLGCFTLGDFMLRALSAYEGAYYDDANAYKAMLEKIEPGVDKVLADRGVKPGADKERAAAKDAALQAAVKLGPPSTVLSECMKRFPAEVPAPDTPALTPPAS